MSNRNFILLIVILIIITLSVFGFLYFNQETNTATDAGEDINFISRFNPFSTQKTTPPGSVTSSVDVTIPPGETEEIPMQKLRKVSSMPIAGFGVFMKERLKEVPVVVPTTTTETTGTVTSTAKALAKTTKPTPPVTEFVQALRYVERTTGNIYQTFTDKIEERKFSGTTIPKIHEAYFGNKATSVIMRRLKIDDRTIETFFGTLPKEVLGADETENNEIKGSFLPENITDMSVSPDVTKIFYLMNVGDNAIGTILNLLDNKKVQIFESAFTEWLTSWPRIGVVTLTTKPSWNTKGYMYEVNTGTKSFTKVLGGINGLTTLASPDGKLVLHSNNNLSLSIYHTDTKTSTLLGIRTLSEKCVWGKLSDTIYCAVPELAGGIEYPDVWYQGEVSFSDQIWKIDIKTGNTTMISDPNTVVGGEAIDGMKLALDQNERYLFFVNKKDSFLWELELN